MRSPYPIYLVLETGTSFLVGIANATVVVYWVTSGRLNPLQLVLLGTVLELSYFVFQLPTGVLADLVSRRLCVLVGLAIVGLALVLEGLSPAFGNLLSAQVVLGLGAALNGGAQQAWIADELGDDRMTGVYLRATQFGLLGTVAGSLLSGVIALVGLNVPLIVAGGLLSLFAGALAFVMPERNFTPAATGGVARQSWSLLTGQTRAAHKAIVAVPGLVLLFGMTLFAGMWSESFDRLYGAFLLRDIALPIRPAMLFSFMACAIALLGLGSTQLAKRVGPDSVAGALLVATLAIGGAVVALATARTFAVAIAAVLAVSAMRPVLAPLVTGWMVTRVEPSVRATALSAQEMFDSGGQIVGGPIVGAIGTLTTIRIALLAGAAALAPAAGCLIAASRKTRAPEELAV